MKYINYGLMQEIPPRKHWLSDSKVISEAARRVDVRWGGMAHEGLPRRTFAGSAGSASLEDFTEHLNHLLWTSTEFRYLEINYLEVKHLTTQQLFPSGTAQFSPW